MLKIPFKYSSPCIQNSHLTHAKSAVSNNAHCAEPCFGSRQSEIADIPGEYINYFAKTAQNINTMSICCDVTKADAANFAKKSRVFNLLDEDLQKYYLKDLYAMCNTKKADKDFLFSKRFYLDKTQKIISDVDNLTVIKLLDIKYSRPSEAQITDDIIDEFKNGKISRTALGKYIYMLENNIPDIEENLKHKPEEFFIQIPGYGKNYDWADYMCQSADLSAMKIKNNEHFRSVLDGIAEDLSQWDLNHLNNGTSIEKAIQSGSPRYDDKNLEYSMTPFNANGVKYSRYGKKFADFAQKNQAKAIVYIKAAKIPEQFSEFRPTKVTYYPARQKGELKHDARHIEQTFNYCENIYDNVTSQYMGKKLKKADIKEVNKQIATLHWLLAHTMPYHRGSDAIINTFIKSLYSALGFQMSPPKEGISFDLEAFCSELNTYIRKYPLLYETGPKYVL